MEIDKRLVQILFDLVAGSMDFGSGHLVDEDVEAMREVAVLIGVDPLKGTPENFQCKYTGAHRWRPLAKEYLPANRAHEATSWVCWRCHRVEVTKPPTGTLEDFHGKPIPR